MIDLLIAWAIRHRAAVLFLVVALTFAGTWALRTLRVDAFPDLTDVQVNVLTEAPGLTPLEVERLVTYPLEVSLNGIPRVTQIRSLSRYGLSSITVVFEDGVDIYFARTQVTERIQAARSTLPSTADMELAPLAGAIGELYQYTVEGGGLDIMQLRTIQDRIVKPQLKSVPGVVEVNAFGGEVREVQVTVSPERLASRGLTLREVVTTVEANGGVSPGGYLEHGDEQVILRGISQPTGPDDVRRTVIRAGTGGVPVTIGDVAEVGYGSGLRQGAVTRDGRGEVVAGIVMALRGVNSRELVTRIRAKVEEINRALPPGVKVVPYYDQTDLVEGTLRTVRTNLLEGGFLVIAILLLFLGNVRAALLVAATIPLSLLFAFLGMRWLGLSANLMSLGAIDFGMIVDGSVVMAEFFVRRLHEDEQREGATGKIVDAKMLSQRLMEAAHEVGRPIAFGVLIIMLVYVPIMTLQGLEARMFRPMALTVAMALFGSLLLALTFVPAASTFIFRRGARESRFAVRLASWIDARYSRLLERTLARPRQTLVVALGVFVAAMFLAPRLGTEFLPEIDEGSLMIEALRDPSVSLTRSLEMQRDVEKVTLMTPEVTTVLSQIGRPEVASDPMGVDRGEVFVMLKPRSEWRASMTKDDIQEEIEHRLADRVPGIAVRMTQPMAMRLDELVSGVRADLAVKVFGDDPTENRRVAEHVAEVVGRVAGAADVQVEATEGQSYLEIVLQRDAMARYGIPMTDAQLVIQSAVSRTPVSKVVDGNYLLNVVVQYPSALRSSPEALGAITVPGAHESRVPLSMIADIRLRPGPVLMRRERGQRLVVVQSNVERRDLGGFVADVKSAIDRGVKLPTGVFLTYGGEFENQERAMSRLKLVVPLSVALIALLLYVSLHSWGLALLVLTNLPFAAVGGVAALWLRGLHLSVSASIGFIALFGVSVLNGLVLLTTVQRTRQLGESARQAAFDGSRERLRPVLMTALVASIGFIPVALSHGTGAEVQRPLATVVIGGLVTSTLLTLFVLPTLYAWIEGRKDRPGAGAPATEFSSTEQT